MTAQTFPAQTLPAQTLGARTPSAPRRGFAFAPAEREADQRVPSPASGAPITIRGLSKSFGAKPVLEEIDLHVPAGQFLAVVGKSGCGKSTLLRTVVGLETPTSGAVSLGDFGRSAGRIMFQEHRLLPWASVVDNVRVGIQDARNARTGRTAALEALALVGLADRADEWPSKLSGGQKQRVALARALVSRPKMLALDEPLGALDALTRIDMQALIERVWREQGFTALLVTHDVAEALALADRVLLIEDGRIGLDLAVDLPRPRRRGSPEIARLEGAILDQLFGRAEAPAETRSEVREIYA